MPVTRPKASEALIDAHREGFNAGHAEGYGDGYTECLTEVIDALSDAKRYTRYLQTRGNIMWKGYMSRQERAVVIAYLKAVHDNGA